MAQIKLNSFLILERSFTKRLKKSWRKSSVNLLIRLQKAIKKEDWTEVDIIIESIDFGETLRSNRRFMEFIGKSAFLFGVGRHGDIKKSQFVKDKKKVPFLKEASNNLQSIISEQGTLFIKGNLRKAIGKIKERTQEAKITKATKVRTNAELLKNAVSGQTEGYLETVSSLHNSRLAGWGYVKEAEALGYTTYSVSEQIESDTICPICISMHGKTFEVKQVANRLESLLTIDNLNDLKHIATWPKQNKAAVQSFRNLSNTELVANGWQAPPYHPLCRGLLVRSDDSASLAPIPDKNAQRVPAPAPLPTAKPIEVIPGTPRDKFLPIKPKDANKLLTKDYKDFVGQLSDKQKGLILEYTGPHYDLINGFLRGTTGKKALSNFNIDDVPDELSNLFNNPEAVLKRDVKVWRGFDSEILATQVQKGNLVGTIIQDKGFTSTSFDLDVADKFIEGGISTAILMEIRVPKSIKQAAIPVDALGIETTTEIGDLESELIFPPDTKFRIIKTIPGDKSSPNTVIAEVIK